MAEPAIEVTKRPRTPQFVDVPPPIKQWADANGKRLSWQSNDPNLLSLKFGQGMVPLRQADLEESAPDVWAEISKRYPIKVTEEGYFQRLDAVLCVQSQEEWQEWEDAENVPGRIREHGAKDMDALEQEIQNALEATGHHSGQPVLRGTVPSARDTVRVAKQPQVAKGVKVGIDKE